jgi:hypothetical protein
MISVPNGSWQSCNVEGCIGAVLVCVVPMRVFHACTVGSLCHTAGGLTHEAHHRLWIVLLAEKK